MAHPPAGMVAPLLKRTTGLLVVAVTDPGRPGQVPPITGTAVTVSPDGRLSFMFDDSVRGVAFALPNAMVNVDVAPACRKAGLKLLVTVGNCNTTTGALAGVALVTPWVVLRAFAGMVLM